MQIYYHSCFNNAFIIKYIYLKGIKRLKNLMNYCKKESENIFKLSLYGRCN